MFKIEDGRSSFWQWDLGQKLVVGDEICGEVHFCNRTDDCALVCEVYEKEGTRLVDVPNILLQTAATIRVYAYEKSDTESRTLHEKRFSVISRTKPADYVYTETEVLTYANLDERIKALEESSGGGGGDCIVDQTYNANSANAQSGKAVADALKPVKWDVETALHDSHDAITGLHDEQLARKAEDQSIRDDLATVYGDFEDAKEKLYSNIDATNNLDADVADALNRINALEQNAGGEWELLEDITVSEPVVAVGLNVEKINPKKEVHIEGYIRASDNTITSQVIHLHNGTPVFQANVNCKASNVIFLLVDIYKSPRGKTVYDGTFSIYDFAVSGASMKVSKMDKDLTDGDRSRLVESDKLAIRMSEANPIAAGTRIKVWGR